LVLFWSPAHSYAVRPPFPPGENRRLPGWDPAPLLDILGRQYQLGVLLLRRGGFSIGIFSGDVLVDSRTGTRFVKNRHRKGGQSQRRFDRIREKQIDELFEKACDAARAKLGPVREVLDAIFLGGDRRTVQAFRQHCTYLATLDEKLQSRFITTPEPRQETLKLAYQQIWRSDWIEIRQP
jgi:peptide subunit release factor 1 (eRF1)